jgi:tRNA(Ile)-lysidine synthase
MLQEFTAKWHSLVPEGERVLLAVSGGVDSLCLLTLCLDAGLKERIAVAHCNFHLRGAESDADAAFVERFCAERGVKFHHCDFDTLGRSASNGVSVEMAARELRYEYFAGLCSTEGYYATAVAHNSNDNAETLILNLLRGTGLRGISGMAEDGQVLGGRVVRPLLGFSRAQIEEYVRGKGLVWREDRTNGDCAYSRNRVRNRIFPEMARINPSFLTTLSSDMQHFAQAAGVLDEYWTKSRKRIEIAPGEVSIEALRAESQREYLLWRFAEPAGLSEDCLASLSRLVFSCEEGKTLSGKVFEGSNARILTAPGRLVLSYDSHAAGSEVVADGPGVYELHGKRMEIRLEDYVNGMERIGGQLVADAAKISFPLKLRGWRSGDWICPFGMRGRRKKLSDVFTELGYSASQKALAIVVELDGSHAALVSGYRIDEALRVDSSTAKVFVFKIL